MCSVPLVSPFSPTLTGVEIALWVTPSASRDKVGEVMDHPDYGPVLKIAVTAPPEKGKANAGVIKLLAKQLQMPKTSLHMTQGEAHRFKVITIDGGTDDLMHTLQEALIS